MARKINLTPEQVEYFRLFGKSGGRPATVPHKGIGYCRCAECRRSGGERDRKEAAEVIEHGPYNLESAQGTGKS